MNRTFKKNVYNINFVNVERLLLSRESLQQIICLLLLKFFVTTKSRLTQIIDELYQDCSTLFDALLSRFEQQQFVEDEDFVFIQGNENHRNLVVLTRLQVKHCKEVLDLFIRFTQLTQAQNQALKKIYERDYVMSYVMHFEFDRIS